MLLVRGGDRRPYALVSSRGVAAGPRRKGGGVTKPRSMSDTPSVGPVPPSDPRSCSMSSRSMSADGMAPPASVVATGGGGGGIGVVRTCSKSCIRLCESRISKDSRWGLRTMVPAGGGMGPMNGICGEDAYGDDGGKKGTRSTRHMGQRAGVRSRIRHSRHTRCLHGRVVVMRACKFSKHTGHSSSSSCGSRRVLSSVSKQVGAEAGGGRGGEAGAGEGAG